MRIKSNFVLGFLLVFIVAIFSSWALTFQECGEISFLDPTCNDFLTGIGENSDVLTISSSISGVVETYPLSGSETLFDIYNGPLSSFLSSDYCSRFGGGFYSFSTGNTQINLEWYRSNFVKGTYSSDLGYCYSTTDLIERGFVPRSWVGHNLLLYCNEGNEVFSSSSSFSNGDVRVAKLGLIDDLNVYKSCILKNLDFDSKNTVFFGYTRGNQDLQASGTFDESDFSFFGNTVKQELANLGYVAKYNPKSSFFYIQDENIASDYYPLTSVFGDYLGVNDILKSNLLYARSIGGFQNIYGYNVGSNYFVSVDQNNPDLEFVSQICDLGLAKYGATVICNGNSIAVSNFGDNQKAFSLIKNLVSNLEVPKISPNSIVLGSFDTLVSRCFEDGGNPTFMGGSEGVVCRFTDVLCPLGWTLAGYTTTKTSYARDGPEGSYATTAFKEGPGPRGEFITGACFTGAHSFSKTLNVEECLPVSYGQSSSKSSGGLSGGGSTSWFNVQSSPSTPTRAKVLEVGCRLNS